MGVSLKFDTVCRRLRRSTLRTTDKTLSHYNNYKRINKTLHETSFILTGWSVKPSSFFKESIERSTNLITFPLNIKMVASGNRLHMNMRKQRNPRLKTVKHLWHPY